LSPPRTPNRRPAGRIAFVGAGPGDPGLLTVRAQTLIATADLLVADDGVDRACTLGCPGEVVVATGTAAERTKALVAAARAGRFVVRLVAGDPLASAAEEVEATARAKASYDVVPGLPAAFAVPAYAGIALPPRKGRRDIRIVDAEQADDWGELAASPTLVLTGPVTAVVKAASALVEHGATVGTPCAVTVGGTTVRQRTVVTTLGDASVDVAAAGLDGAAVAVVGDAVTSRERLSWWESKPLFGWHVLVPRTREQAASLSEQLRAYGAVPVEVPTIAVEPPRTPAAMDRAVKGLVSGRYLWVAFTSTNAVRAMREKFESVGLDVRAFAGIKVAAIGEQTAAALRGWGIEPELMPEGDRQSSEGLVEVWPAYDDVFDPIDRVLLPRADIATETLVAGLQELGWQVDDVTAYRTVRAAPPAADIRDAIKGGGFDAVLFTSSSTVRNLVGIAGKPHPSTVIAVIGPQTAKTAEEQGLRVDVLAAEASVPALVEALADYGRDRRLAGEPGRPAARAPAPSYAGAAPAGRRDPGVAG
jgi:uroporphyrinogen III methyltransferase/synthase